LPHEAKIVSSKQITETGNRGLTSSIIECQFCYWPIHVIHVISCYLVSISLLVIYVISCHFMSFHVISCHFLSFPVISCHFMSFHVIKFQIVSYHVSLGFCDHHSIKSGRGRGRGRVKYVFLGLWRQLRCQAEGKKGGPGKTNTERER
jgi:hypothetical protein